MIIQNDNKLKTFGISLLAAAVLGLTGCGGGGGSGSSTNDPIENPDDNNPQPPEEPVVAAWHQAINFDPAKSEYTGEGVNVAVYDSGILIGHDEFPAERVSQFSGAYAFELSDGEYRLIDTSQFVQDDHSVDVPTENTMSASDLRHGALVASIAIGEGLGVARGATLMMYDTLFSKKEEKATGATLLIDPTGQNPIHWDDPDCEIYPGNPIGCGSFTSSMAGLLHVANKGASDINAQQVLNIHFANISISRTFETSNLSEGVFQKIALNSQTAVIATAGNNSIDLTQEYEGSGGLQNRSIFAKDESLKDIMVIVGAMTQDGTTIWSDSGTPGSDSQIQSRFLVAPGVSIRGASHESANQHAVASGTSFAAPLVTGAAAVVQEKFSQLTPRQVLQVLLDTANKDIQGYDPAIHGQGLLDVEAALNVDPYDYSIL